MKVCSGCGLSKSLDEFSPNSKGLGGRASRCKECARNYAAAHYTKPAVKRRRRAYAARADVRKRERRARKSESYRVVAAKRQRKYRNDARTKVIALLGGACRCCGETFVPFLEVHHLNGDGRAHRAEGGSMAVMKSIIAGTYPTDQLEILCANCHTATTRYGRCEKEHPRL